MGFSYFTIDELRDVRVHFDKKQQNMKEGHCCLELTMTKFFASQPLPKNGEVLTKIKVLGFMIIAH